MNREQEEKTIRELFRQLRREDERSAPPFANSLEVALARQERADRSRLVWRVAVAAAALVLLGGSWWLFFEREAKTTVPVVTVKSGAPDNRIEPEVGVIPLPNSPATLPRERRVRSVRRQQRPKPRQTVTLISQWRSPTEFLLRTPGEQLLKSVPRLNESLIRINASAPDRRPVLMDKQN
jgi:hypothetical protein